LKQAKTHGDDSLDYYKAKLPFFLVWLDDGEVLLPSPTRAASEVFEAAAAAAAPAATADRPTL